jgi:hypothetical protein
MPTARSSKTFGGVVVNAHLEQPPREGSDAHSHRLTARQWQVAAYKGRLCNEPNLQRI